MTGGEPDTDQRWAVLLDMDGLLVDSEPVWTVAEREIAQRLGGVFSAQAKAAMMGQRLETAVPLLLSFLGTPASASADPVEVGLQLLERMTQLLGHAPPLMPGAADLLEGLTKAGVPTALVSSSYRRLVDAVLAGFAAAGIGHRFDVTVAGDEVGAGKPDPEPYLTAAARLSVPARRCVVLEDSTAGMRSGIAAGCRVVLVPSMPEPATVSVPAGVELAGSLDELDVGRLAGLVGLAVTP